eukprot:12415334-Karenia_brevis.AAC.1
MSFTKLVDDTRVREATSFPDHVHADDIVKVLPSITSLQLLCCKADTEKSFGEDLLCNALIKSSPVHFAKMYHP